MGQSTSPPIEITMTPAIEKHTYPDSWYAASTTPLPAQPMLQGRIEADVCILGAGYTGL